MQHMKHRRRTTGAVVVTVGALLALSVAPTFAWGGSPTPRMMLLSAEQAGANADELNQIDALEAADGQVNNSQGDQQDPTATPEPTDTPEATHTPEPTETPEGTHAPKSTHAPEATDKPENDQGDNQDGNNQGDSSGSQTSGTNDGGGNWGGSGGDSGGGSGSSSGSGSGGD
jgi:uncharacterized membrane protein YgcG